MKSLGVGFGLDLAMSFRKLIEIKSPEHEKVIAAFCFQ